MHTLTAYSFSSLLSHLCANRTTEVAPLPIATRSQTPYFFNKPAESVDRSESDFLLALPEERAEDLRANFGPELRSSFSVNFPSPSLDLLLIDEGREGGKGRVVSSDAARSLPYPPSLGVTLTARLGGRLEGGLGPHSLSEAEGESAVDGVVVPVLTPDIGLVKVFAGVGWILCTVGGGAGTAA